MKAHIEELLISIDNALEISEPLADSKITLDIFFIRFYLKHVRKIAQKAYERIGRESTTC